MRVRSLALLLLIPLFTGCGPIGAIIYYLHPPQKIDPEFKLTTGKVAILIETARSNEENPLFAQALFDKLIENMQAAKTPVDAIPLDQVLRLRQEHADFAKWGVQRIGRELKAEQVIYIRVARLQFRESPESPLLEPRVAATIVVIGVDAPADKPRLWPDAAEAREFTAGREIREVGDQRVLDDEAAKLGKDVANMIARYFHEYDPEDKIVKER